MKPIMGPANHHISNVTTYPFQVFGGVWAEKAPPHLSQLPFKDYRQKQPCLIRTTGSSLFRLGRVVKKGDVNQKFPIQSGLPTAFR